MTSDVKTTNRNVVMLDLIKVDGTGFGAGVR